jgi:hypothetical protein
MTPDEFNKVGTQVQLEIFNNYVNDLHQQYRSPQNDTEYANRVKNIEASLQFFQKYISNSNVAGAITGTNPFTLNVRAYTAGVETGPGPMSDLYRIGSVMYRGLKLNQYSQRNEITQLLLSPLTQPTTNFPIYLYEAGATTAPANPQIYMYPTTIVTPDDINISYLAKPADINWGFSTGDLGQLLYQSGDSVNFSLSPTEQTNVILKILLYAGVIINDPTIIQVASSQVQQEEQNSKI